jgi:hypothetical protein
VREKIAIAAAVVLAVVVGVVVIANNSGGGSNTFCEDVKGFASDALAFPYAGPPAPGSTSDNLLEAKQRAAAAAARVSSVAEVAPEAIKAEADQVQTAVEKVNAKIQDASGTPDLMTLSSEYGGHRTAVVQSAGHAVAIYANKHCR